MPQSKIIFFSVGNGDMTLIKTISGKNILIDVNIRKSSVDCKDSDTPDVLFYLKKHLPKNKNNQYYVDVFLLSHPDKDHCTGLVDYFHLNAPDNSSDDKIRINEIWSSPMVFRRVSSKLTLCEDAKAFNKEAKRRIKVFKNEKSEFNAGNMILILGEDENGKTDDLQDILVKQKECIRINENNSAYLIAPFNKGEKECEELLTKNNSSCIMQFHLSNGAVKFLTGGDAEVSIWEKIWDDKSLHQYLNYDILQVPHHCSWHSISHDSISEKGSNALVSDKAKNAFSQGNRNSYIIASSNQIEDNDIDPPSYRTHLTKAFINH